MGLAGWISPPKKASAVRTSSRDRVGEIDKLHRESNSRRHVIPIETMKAPSIIKAATSTSAAIERIAQGLEWADAEFVAKKLGVSLDRFAVLVGVPRSTFFRRQSEGRFTEAESEHIMRFARLWQVACEVFPREAGAQSWLNRAQVGLDGKVPLDYAKSELGARVVEDLLMRIHHGILA